MTTLNQSIRVGLFFILGVALIWTVYEALNQKKLTQDKGYQIKAHFNNLKQLKPGDEVRMAGVNIGTVKKTFLKSGQAVAVLLIDPSQKIPNDSEATVAMASLLGSNFVSIAYGSPQAQPLAPNGVINTVSTVDLNTVLNEFSNVGKTLGNFLGADEEGGEQNVFTQLSDLIRKNEERISTTLKNIEIITQSIVDAEGTIGKLISDDTIYNSLTEISKNANILIVEARGIIDDVRGGKGTLGALIANDQMAKDLQTTLANFKDLSNKINSNEGTLGRLINDDSLYRETQTVLNKFERTLDGFNESGPIVAVGVAVNALF